jgi:imidazole glycerol phosphate synthase subunit HisF
VSFDVVDESAKKIYIYVKNPDDLESLEAMKREMMEHYGNNEVILVLGEKKDAIRLPFKIQVDENLINSISDIFGKDCVVVK